MYGFYLFSKTSPWEKSIKDYKYILNVYLAVMAYKSRGNVSSLKSVLVNPSNHGLQIQWYVLVFYIKVGFYYIDLPVSGIKVKTIVHFSFRISLCPRQMLRRYCTS